MKPNQPDHSSDILEALPHTFSALGLEPPDLSSLSVAPETPPEELLPLPMKAEVGPRTLVGSLSPGSALEWCCTATGSLAAFLMNLDCVVIAAVGSLSPGQVAPVAPRLLSALEQLSLVDQPLGPCWAVSGHLGGSWLTGFTVQVPGDLPLLLGLVGPSVVEGSLKPQFDQIFSYVSLTRKDSHEDDPHC
jgi:hypothetical protein